MLEKFSVRKPMTVAVAVIAVILIGIISFTRMPTDLLPSMDLPYAAVITAYPGASPEKVETSVTRPLEQSLATLSGVENITSVSNENSSMIILEFSQGINMDSVMIEMNNNLDLVKSSLDDAVGSPIVMKINPDMMPVMIASVDAEGKDIYELSKLVEDEIVPEFERLDGVASVTASGLVEKQLSVTLNQEKIDGLNKKILDAVDAKMADAEAQMQQGETQLASAKAQLEEQKKTQGAALSEKALQIKNGKDQVQTGLAALPAAQASLQQNLTSLTQQKQALDKLLELQQQAGIGPTEAEQKLLSKLQSGIEQCENGLKEIADKSQSLTETLRGLNNAEQQLETGRSTMNAEFVKAEVTIQQKEQELGAAREQLDEANKSAYSQAGLDGRLTITTVSQMLTAQNFSMPAGYLTDGDRKFAVKVGDKFGSEAELRELVLFNMELGDIGAVTLSDVADIACTDNADEMYAKINGNDGVLLSFQKQSTASTAEVSDKIGETIQSLSDSKNGVHITALNDQGTYIDIVVNSVIQNLLLGGVLAILILLLFLRNARPTIIIAFSIPISLMFAVVLMYFSGVTLNVISLAGLALGVGMLVDNSIVVIENTYRLRSQGMSAAQAAVKGAAQVAGAITASTLTTICVFLPIVFMEGLSRQLFMDMGLTIAYSLLASLFVALTLVPAMSATVLRKSEEKPHKLFDRFKEFYGRMLSGALRLKPVVIVFSVLLLVGSSVGAVLSGTALMPETDSRQVMVTMEMPPESTTQESRDTADTLLKRMEQIEGVKTVGAMEGGMMSGMMGGGSSNSMMMYVLLEDEHTATSNEIALEIEKTAEGLPCTLTATGSGMDMSALGGSGIQITVQGDDLDALRETAAEVAGMLGEVEGLTEISDGQEENDTELRIQVNKAKATQNGLMVAQVYQQVAAA
ncbi:MAG: MMPL family transporter, partial [Clostridiales bacterium]|nr:MMPL family transporter [Clostridiales bacterium]